MGYGIKKVFLTPLDTVDDSDKEGVGTVRFEGDNEYVYAKGVASTAAGRVVVLHEDYTTALITTALGAVPRRVAVAMAAIIANKYGWYQVKGQSTGIYCAASCAANVPLYTDVSTDGGLDDTAGSEHAVSNIWLTAAVGGGGAANATGYLNHPHTLPQLD